MYKSDMMHQDDNMMHEAMDCCEPMNCCEPIVCPPVMECPEERCHTREIVHEVPHIVPINTKIINCHVYKHVWIPKYTCCEENRVVNVCEKRCRF